MSIYKDTCVHVYVKYSGGEQSFCYHSLVRFLREVAFELNNFESCMHGEKPLKHRKA